MDTPDIYSRVVAVLKGEKPDRIPFCDRLEIWHRGLSRRGQLPQPYADMSLLDIHAKSGMGIQKYFPIHHMRLRGVELIACLDGEEYFHEKDPLVDTFPRMYSVVNFEKAGITDLELITPKGKLTVRHEMLQSMVDDGMHPYLNVTPIKDPSDYPAFEYVIENAEFVYRFDEYYALQKEFGKLGYVLPMTERLPFQQLLIDCVGEIALFYMMSDEPDLFAQLMKLLDEKLTEALKGLANFQGEVIEFPDNLEAQMTNPSLFKRHSLPYYQKYADLMHGFGIKISSHTDGNLKPLLGLLAECGLDMCESISPAPLTAYTFDEVWNAWKNGPIIWGAIPSPIMEKETSEADFRAFIHYLLEIIDEPRIILGVSDMMLPINDIKRVRYIADRIEEHPLA